ncbi:MAG TPA: hypothetical protein EYN54_00925 [Methylococcaceae bacterium]|nr:hypothetical protein [Methylococcaceae bacterium]
MPVEILTTIYSQHTIHLQRIGATEGLKVTPFLIAIENDVVSILNKYRKRRVTPALQELIQKQINEATRKHLQDYTSQLKVENRAVGAFEAEFAATTLNGVVDNKDFNATVPSAAAVNSVATITPVKLGANSFTAYSTMMRNYWSKWTDEVNGIVQAGFLEGSTIPEITNAITAQMDLSKSGTTKSVLDRARRSAKQLAITGTNHYANTARIAFVDENDDILKGYRFLAVNDSRTSRVCARLDQTVYPANSPKLSSVTPPLHPNACVEGTLITTKRGLIPIEHVFVGDYALSHTNEYRRVTCVMAKKNDTPVLELINNFGERIRLTNDHPILTSDGWKKAGDVKRGDKIFNNPDKFIWSKHWLFGSLVKQRVLIDTHNIETQATKELIPYNISSFTAGVSSSIKLNKYISDFKVRDILTNWYLKLIVNIKGFKNVDK